MKMSTTHWRIARVLVFGFAALLIAGIATSRLSAQESERQRPSKAAPAGQSPGQPSTEEPPHRFWDKTNLMLFAGVAAVRTLDFTSTQHFRSRGHNEVLLSNDIVDNKPLFAGIEVAGAALSIGLSYWLHRTGHHKLERWVSVVHIGAAGFGDIHNYTLSRTH